MKILLTITAFLVILSKSFCQTVISGLVADADSKEPLPFTNIAVLGLNTGTVSNAEGHFVIEQEGITTTDTILFSHVGYEVLKLSVGELQGLKNIYMHVANINLQEFQVSSKPLKALDIIDLVVLNQAKNYPSFPNKQRVFFHKYEKTPFPKENKVILKKSNFVGLEPQIINELLDMIPDKFTEYRDALLELYTDGNTKKIVPVEAVSLEESSMQMIGKAMEDKLGNLFNDIEKTNADKDVYYKFRTGIFGMKMDNGNDDNNDVWREDIKDSLNYVIKSNLIKNEVFFLFDKYVNFESDNWEFINKTNRYNYVLDEVTIVNDELVYKISFTPKNRGLFEGQLYVSTLTYAILQLDFNYARGKRSENIKLFGIGHSMDYKEGHVIFEKRDAGYFLKYIYAQQREFMSFDRKFSVLKKKKRFLFDKELNEIKLDVDLVFNVNSFYEVLILDRENIEQKAIENIAEPKVIKFRKEYAYNPDLWKNSTVITPTSELKKLKRRD